MFVVFQPTADKCGIPRGRFSLVGKGMARFNTLDLKAVKIKETATILIDSDKRRLAIRAASDPSPAVAVGEEEDGGARRIWLGGALKALGLDVSQLRGRHPCRVEPLDDKDVLVLDLANNS